MPHTPTPAKILEAVCQAFSVLPQDVLSGSREKVDVVPREVYVYLLKFRGALSVKEIGPLVGLNDSQIFHIIRVVTDWIRIDADFAAKVLDADILIIGKILVATKANHFRNKMAQPGNQQLKIPFPQGSKEEIREARKNCRRLNSAATTPESIQRILNLYNTGSALSDIADALNVQKSIVTRIIRIGNQEYIAPSTRAPRTYFRPNMR